MKKYQHIFGITHPIILFSTICIGILASIPKFLRLHIATWEMLIDVSVASCYSLFVWYFNLQQLAARVAQSPTVRFAWTRFAYSVGSGILVMTLLVIIHQLIFPHYHMPSMMLMFQFRGLVINCTIFLFLFLLFQQYHNRKITQEAQFELLKQQVNPHFLFNSLNTLKSMVDMQDKQASEFIVMLSDFYRAALDKKQQAIVPLATELHTLESYVFLLKARFEDGLDLRVNVPENSLFIPAFTLQLLVENCIKHNIVSLEYPLHISIYIAEEHLIVENNLQLKRSSCASTMTGLENICSRFEMLGKERPQVLQTATHFTVKLPLIYADSDH